MKLIYLTSQKYPSSKVDPFYWESMARAFSSALNDRFLFLVRDTKPETLHNIRVFSVNAPQRFRTFFYFFLLPKLIAAKKWYRCDTIFFSADSYLLCILIFWRSLLGLRYSICSDWHMLFDDWRDSYISKNSDFLITTSVKLKEQLISVCGADPEKILTAYGGVDWKRYESSTQKDKRELRRELDLPEHAFLVGYVGGFRSVGLEKGIDTMIASLTYTDPEVVMVFVGGSRQDSEAYLELANEKNVSQRCIFIAKQPFEKAILYELAMDALVIPYPNKHHFRNYGFPLKVWEYMAAGCPIIYSNLDIIDEALSGKGIPFVAGVPRKLADAIAYVDMNSEELTRRALKNREYVKAFTWDMRVKRILHFIEKR